MIFTELHLPGAFLIQQERAEDERGFFARTWCKREFAAHGLNPALVQCNLSYNEKKGTVRGLHFQKAPHGEAKIVTCFQGAIYDVIVDLRPESPTCWQWLAVELTGENLLSLYIPEGFAHGFQTLKDRTLVFYQMSEFYYPQCAAGIRWDDAALGITWPLEVSEISKKDASHPLLKQGQHSSETNGSDPGLSTFGPLVKQEHVLWGEGTGLACPWPPSPNSTS